MFLVIHTLSFNIPIGMIGSGPMSCKWESTDSDLLGFGSEIEGGTKIQCCRSGSGISFFRISITQEFFGLSKNFWGKNETYGYKSNY